MSERKYPRLGNEKRKPDLQREGDPNCGLPCIVCSKYTLGKMFVETTWTRGDYELVAVCSDHWNTAAIIDAFVGLQDIAETRATRQGIARK